MYDDNKLINKMINIEYPKELEFYLVRAVMETYIPLFFSAYVKPQIWVTDHDVPFRYWSQCKMATSENQFW